MRDPALDEAKKKQGPPPDPPLTVSPSMSDADLLKAPTGSQVAEGAALIQRGDWAKAKAVLSARVEKLDASGRMDDAVAARALLARACDKLKDTACVAEQSAKVVALWKLPDWEPRLTTGARDEGEKSRRLERAVTAMGETLFLAAEQKRAEADAITFPAYSGPGDREDVLKFVNGPIKTWVQKKRPAVETVDGAYLTVLHIPHGTPAHWAIAAAERAGTTWMRFVREFRSPPVPNEWKGEGKVPGAGDLTYAEIRGEFIKALAEASEPQRLRARRFFTVCRDIGAKHGIADEHTRACEAALAATP
jgi:hypothetical protein